MRMKRSRVKEYFCRKAVPVKDREGGTSLEYQPSIAFTGEVWPAGGKIQAEQYGNRLGYIRNIKIQGKYEISPDEKGRLHYVFPETGLDIVEGDGLCLHVPGDAPPDYRVISIRPYTPLRLEAEALAASTGMGNGGARMG